MTDPWSPDSWKQKLAAQAVGYADIPALAASVRRLAELPPLVTSWEVETLKRHLAEAQEGRRFVLQGGDCAETLADCQSDIISKKLKILLQMSLVLIHGAKKPVVRIGRFAGQYAKPRSQSMETQHNAHGESVQLPSYFGDLVNRAPFTAQDRIPDPALLLAGYQHAALTLNFIRSLADGGFADLHHPETWNLSFLGHADLSEELRAEYERTSASVGEALRFMEAVGDRGLSHLSRVTFYTSHEGLNLHYESAQTRRVPHREGHFVLTTHLPWIGDRTRQLDGAHVEFFRGVKNPVGVKIGPSMTPEDLVRLIERLNPTDEPGKLVLITRLGAKGVAAKLPPLLRAVQAAGRRVLWMSDPMHGNTHMTGGGIKTRSFGDILAEVQAVMQIHEAEGTVFGGVHFELTGDDVTECVGAGTTEADLSSNYATACDPRLNYRQALEMAFLIARQMRAT